VNSIAIRLRGYRTSVQERARLGEGWAQRSAAHRRTPAPRRRSRTRRQAQNDLTTVYNDAAAAPATATIATELGRTTETSA
jgi:hypothetical protein